MAAGQNVPCKVGAGGTYFRERSYSTPKDVRSHTEGVLLANPIIDEWFQLGSVLLALTVHTRIDVQLWKCLSWVQLLSLMPKSFSIFWYIYFFLFFFFFPSFSSSVHQFVTGNGKGGFNSSRHFWAFQKGGRYPWGKIKQIIDEPESMAGWDMLCMGVLWHPYIIV